MHNSKTVPKSNQLYNKYKLMQQECLSILTQYCYCCGVVRWCKLTYLSSILKAYCGDLVFYWIAASKSRVQGWNPKAMGDWQLKEFVLFQECQCNDLNEHCSCVENNIYMLNINVKQIRVNMTERASASTLKIKHDIISNHHS